MFHTMSNRSGSYYTTDNEEEQRALESSEFFGDLYRLKRESKAEPVKVAAEVAAAAKEKKAENVYETSVLQEAKEIIARIRSERGLKPRGMTNKQSVLNAAAELGLEFPNLTK